MEETILLRRATGADLVVLLQCEQGIIKAERPFSPTLKDDPVRYYDLEKMLTDPQTDVVVAEMNNEIIGCGYSRIEDSKPYYKHSQHAYLGMMYVRPEHRGKGINKLVIEELKTLAKRRGVTELRLEVFAGNQSAIKAYEKVGFQPLMTEMRMSLD
ncbi:MAG TPA: GNAT family N-acetyltransferase [Flavisolibacter sp.]|jgi:ribosomal protein S18 acetylase RimI-like enzyme|nr:GNAT family N-acetyltransferase [Flavisolibacter sp.]